MIRSFCPTSSFRGNTDLIQLLNTQKLYKHQIEIPQLSMLPVLEEIESKLPKMMRSREIWKSLFIDYQPPYLMRIYCEVPSEVLEGKCVRANLHYFLPSKTVSTENLYHPHAWASCMRIVHGVYDQFIGFADHSGFAIKPPFLCRLTHSSGDSYAMNHPWLWHQVNPYPNQAVSTLMVTYIPEKWDQDIPRSTKTLRVLNDAELEFMFNHFSKD